MAKTTKTKAATDLPEELLDRSIGVLEGPVNAVLERVLKSRVFLWPVGLSQAIAWKALGKVMGHKVGRLSSKPSSSSQPSSSEN